MMNRHLTLALLLTMLGLVTVFSGCQLSSCSIPNAVKCEYCPPSPLPNMEIQANCCGVCNAESDSGSYAEHPMSQDLENRKLAEQDVQYSGQSAPNSNHSDYFQRRIFPRQNYNKVGRRVRNSPLVGDFR